MKRSVLYKEKIVELIGDLNQIKIDKLQRRRLISTAFSLSGKYEKLDLALREGVREAYLENLNAENALDVIEEKMGLKDESSMMPELVRYSNYN